MDGTTFLWEHSAPPALAVNNPTDPFKVSGPVLDRDRVRLALGASAALNETLALSLGYSSEIARSDAHHKLAAALYWRF